MLTYAVEALILQHHTKPGGAYSLGWKPSCKAAKKGHGAVLALLFTHDEESIIEPTTPYEPDDDQPYLECNLYNLRILRTAFHFHCNLCADGDWEVCEVCRECRATCVETARVLVKRTMIDGLRCEVKS